MEIKLTAEIGINHNGDLELAKKLIDLAYISGFNFVKFQKRDIDSCIPEDKKNEIRSTPWGDMTYYDYKKRLEFGEKEYQEIEKYCRNKIVFYFSVWDLQSAEFAKKYMDIVKVPSPMLTDDNLLIFCRKNFKTLVLSTGMSTEEQIKHALEIGNPDTILHCHSGYPSSFRELDINYILRLKEKYSNKKIGYSGHECGLTASIAAAALGAEWIERHITLDKHIWGSDHLASINPIECFRLVRSIREIELAMGSPGPRQIKKSEIEKLQYLRK